MERASLFAISDNDSPYADRTRVRDSTTTQDCSYDSPLSNVGRTDDAIAILGQGSTTTRRVHYSLPSSR